MSRFKIAHIREQGIDLIIIPLDSTFGHKSNQDQFNTIASLQLYAKSAGLAGTVVPIWREGNSHKFIASTNWHSFFKSLGWNDVMANINKELICG